MWTFLRLLTIEESLFEFLETETREDVPKQLGEARKEVAQLRAEVEAHKARGTGSAQEARERLLTSREEVLTTLQKHVLVQFGASKLAMHHFGTSLGLAPSLRSDFRSRLSK